MAQDQSLIKTKNSGRRILFALSLIVSTASACSTTPGKIISNANVNAQDLLIVDCLLPPQVRQLGTQLTYLAQRRAIRTSGADCAIRGGEYIAYNRADFKSALAVWLPQAEQGDPEAQTYVGEIYEKGLGTRASYEIAASWYQRAAKQDYSRAKINLGYLYESGLGVERDLPRAMNLYRQASGFTAADIEFVSSIEVANRAATRMQSKELQAQVEIMQTEISASQRKLQTKKAQLQQSENEVKNLRKSLAIRKSLTTEQSNTVQPSGLSINIIDPPILITRGATALTVNRRGEIDMIGKIDSVSELFAFRINGVEHPVNPTGLFRIDTTSVEGDNLELLAVDSQGSSTRLELSITHPAASKTNATVTRQLEFEKTQQPRFPISDVELGSYHALIIGNNSYASFGNLKTATNDATALERILREKYGFKTMIVLDANQKTILTALERMRTTLQQQDNLVIYYAGHGELDEQSGQGYWLPVDSDIDNKDKWIANNAITSIIDTMKAKHVLVIADSCYSGSLTRSSIARPLSGVSAELRLKWLKAVSQSRVRTVLSSGSNQPVLDGSTSSEHSIFAEQLLGALERNTEVLETYELFFELQQKVSQKASRLSVEQTPQYAPIRHAGHQAGEFIFVPIAQTTVGAKSARDYPIVQ